MMRAMEDPSASARPSSTAALSTSLADAGPKAMRPCWRAEAGAGPGNGIRPPSRRGPGGGWGSGVGHETCFPDGAKLHPHL